MSHLFTEIISVKNLCAAWREFVWGKKTKADVAEFALNLSSNIFQLHEELQKKSYIHGSYKAFKIYDPKPRDIHKAAVRDRLVHHAIYRILYFLFESHFVYDSYSCRNFKGTHRALNRLRRLAWQASRSHHQTCWVLKCDIRKFFASIDHKILFNILYRHISDSDILWLLQKVVESFSPGLPLGNLTSQLLVNVYMNEFDQFVKHQLGIKHYIRYADDFLLISENKFLLEQTLSQLKTFLIQNLKLQLHPGKVCIKTFSSGVDFLGWVHFSDHRVLRTATKKRMFKKIRNSGCEAEGLRSYLGLLMHGNSAKLRQQIIQSIGPRSPSPPPYNLDRLAHQSPE